MQTKDVDQFGQGQEVGHLAEAVNHSDDDHIAFGGSTADL